MPKTPRSHPRPAGHSPPRTNPSTRDGEVPLAATIADVLASLHLVERARLLSRLVAGVGNLALAVVSGGAFARYAAVARRSDFVVSLEDAARATRAQVCELVRYVQQSNPELIARLCDDLARIGAVAATPGASEA